MMTKTMKKGLLGSLVAAACLSLTATGAMALPFTGFPDLEITASLDISGDSDFDGSDASQSGQLGGVYDNGTSFPSADIVTLPPPTSGTLPVGGSLANFSDFASVALFGMGEEVSDFALVALFADLSLDLVNSSATDTFKVSFGFNNEGGVGASGDAFNDLSIMIIDGTTTFVDVSAVADGVLGPTSDTLPEMPTFDVFVAPSSTAMLTGAFDFFGTTVSTGGLFSGGLESSLFVTGVEMVSAPPPPPTTSVPEPGALALFGFGLLGLGAVRRRRRAIP